MRLCISCGKETTREIWPDYPICKECAKGLDQLSLFQLYQTCGEIGLMAALEDIKNGRVKLGKV